MENFIEYLWVHHDNGKLTNQFTGQSTKEQPDFNQVSYDDAESITIVRISHTIKERKKNYDKNKENIQKIMSYRVVEASSVSSSRRRPPRATPCRSVTAAPRRGVMV